ncbi:MAG: hypothetical protein A2X18_12200 [Bacteroidetes bacterium GWF2_40_14]|nr:MAG: hypothetical protein A2X18_12200 [Bacteroidetes bacterium GWF2_40_14]
MLNHFDIKQIEERGGSVESVLREIEFFKNGFPYLKIDAPATPERGIKQLKKEEQDMAVQQFEEFTGSVCKFVPASGAASRMFKELFDGLTLLEKGEDIDPKSSVNHFFERTDSYAFYSDLIKMSDFNAADRLSVIRKTLSSPGLNYASMPKGLIKFHKYTEETRTAFEEHLVEAALYAKGKNGIAKLIVTVSPEHVTGFKSLFEEVRSKYENRYDVTYDVIFTLQKPSTDTIAVDENNEPFRKTDGSLLFRPGGHGALIENLNDINDDIVIIKNIDNVVKEKLLSDTIKWKKVLGGVLLYYQEKIFNYINILDGELDSQITTEIKDFLEREFCIKLPSVPDSIFTEFLRAKLNRPLRVCGMVKNLGEPGGGPYIVYDADGSTSLQILESAQLDMNNPVTAHLMERATHFNPVDIVCSFKDYKGEKFDLNKFVDHETGFISYKSLEGRILKAQELPGLWNGAMSQWNTLFVEVPVSIFNPVKTIFDLLRPEHLD